MKKTPLRRTLSYVKRYSFSLLLSLVFALLSVAFTLYIPMLIGKAVDTITKKGSVDFTSLFPILISIGVSALIIFLSQYLMGLCTSRLAYNVSASMRRDAFMHLHTLPVSFFDSKSHGDIVSRIITDVDQLCDGLLLGFNQLFSGVITIVGTLYFLFSVNFILALAVVLITPLSFFVAAFIAKRTHKMFTLQSRKRGEQTAYTDEMITCQAEVHLFSGEENVSKRFKAINEEWANSSLKATFFSSITNPATRFVNSVVYASVALAGGLLAVRGFISVGALTSALSYANQYTKPFNEISGVVTELQNAIVCASRVFDLIDAKSEKKDELNTLEVKEGAVSFNDISFSYDKERPLISDFSFKAKGGTHVAIVGPTGAGKTTLINLLMRFYELDSGSICIDNMPIDKVSRHSLRSSFGMVLQDTYLLDGTIRDNILLGREATDEEVIKAAVKSHADGFIRRLPNGYETVVSDSSSALSQGERQLLCIARIMLSIPKMLILDEATSSIDTRTEALIQNSFTALMKGRTSFVVAHRLSTIENADVILVLKDGAIVEMGSHQELLNKGGFYSELFKSQFAI